MKKRKLKTKPLILLAIFTIAIIGGTIAYFYQNINIPNQFKTMTYNINLTEEFNNDWGTKNVYITNNESSSTPVVLRISYNEIWSKTVNNNVSTLSNTINGNNLVNKEWTSTFTNDFIDGSDGWYYYKLVLNPNETIQILKSIALNTNLIENTEYYNDYREYNYNLIFNYEVIEAKTTTISEIWGKNASINNQSVTWT